MDDQFIQREEEEQGKEFEEEAEEDYGYLDYDYDADNLEELTQVIREPKVTSWVHSDGKTWEDVMIVNWPIIGRSKNISVFQDVCPICFKALTGSGEHQICCLPCGHIYGRSCIDQWLHQSQNNSKCPQCKSLCTLKDVSLVQATCPCDVVGASPKESGKWFPFTKQGFKAFKRYALRRVDNECGMRLDAARRSFYARLQHDKINRQWSYSNAAGKLPDKYYRLASKSSSQDIKLRSRTMSLLRRIFDYHAGIDSVALMYKKRITRGKNRFCRAKRMATRGADSILTEL